MAIYYNENNRCFYLESKDVTYAFRISEYGFLNQLYFGKKVPRENLDYSVLLIDRGQGCALPNARERRHSLNSYANEYPVYGRSDFRESAFAFCDEKGMRIGDFVYEKYEIVNIKPKLEGMPSVRGSETLIVWLKEERLNAKIALHYTVYENLPVITRHAEIFYEGEGSLTLDRAYSLCLDLPDKNFEALTLTGAHLRERFIERTKLSHSIFSIDSKRGVSSAQANPFIALVRKNTLEDCGEAYGFNLVYSGDFVFKAQIEENDSLRLLGGINDFDFSWELRNGEHFVTPECVMVYSDNGLGELSRTYHDLYRNYLLDPNVAFKPHPIVINNWEATYFDFDYNKLCDIINSVCDTGIDTFVLDDGWFGCRNDDKTSLGDWYVNPKKLPDGLKPIIDFTHQKGMKFGIWFEPEMVSRNSNLYREHPDWIIGAEELTPCLGRDQYVLDLSKNEVCEFVIKTFSDILKNNQIDYVKWDMNRCLTDNYSDRLGKNSKELHHRYVLGLYKICDGIVKAFPNVYFEGCSSGGCRFDPAMLYYFPQIWTSDDSDAYMRSIIQYGTSICYPLSTHSCHVSVCPNHQSGRVTSFKSRGDIAHLGATGYELDSTKLTAEELKTVTKQVDEYKNMQDLVLAGDLYRLSNPTEENLFAEMIVSKDKARAHLTVMRPICIPNGCVSMIHPKGLDKNSIYSIEELNLVLSGQTIEMVGIPVEFKTGDFLTRTFSFRKIK